MKINIGSLNGTKVQAVTEVLHDYPIFKGVKIVPTQVEVELYGHPKSLEETIQGAMDRAKQAFRDCDYAFGLEGGLMTAPHTKTGFMEVTACAIYDGRQYCLGLSPAFEWPKSVTNFIVKDGMDGSQALKKAGFTDHEKIGAAHGGIWYLTKQRMDRKEYMKPAITMSLIQLENPEHY